MITTIEIYSTYEIPTGRLRCNADVIRNGRLIDTWRMEAFNSAALRDAAMAAADQLKTVYCPEAEVVHHGNVPQDRYQELAAR